MSFYNLPYDALNDKSIDAVFDKDVVVGVSPKCARLGVKVGDPASVALTLSPEMKPAKRSLTKESELFREIASLSRTFSPFFTTANSQEMFLSVRSVIRHYGVEGEVVESLSKVLLDNGLVRTATLTPLVVCGKAAKAYFSIGVASTRFYAYLASKYNLIVQSENVKDFVFNLPINDVVPTRFCSELEDLGIKVVEEFLDIGHDHLSKRYGSYGSSLYELLSGERDWTCKLVEAEISWRASVDFDYQATSQEVIFAVSGPVSELLDALEQKAIVPSVVDVCVLTTEEEFSKEVSASHGLTKKVLIERINFYLESLKKVVNSDLGVVTDLYDQGITRVKVTVKEVTSITSTQISLDNIEIGNEDSIQKTLDRVVSLAGDGSVLRPCLSGGRSLSEAASLLPFDEKTITRPKRSTKLTDDPPWPGSLMGLYPTCVYDRPLEVTILGSLGQFISINDRGVLTEDPYEVLMPSGVRLTISNFIGPWIVEERWWTPKRQRYARMLMELLEDATVHLFCRKNQRWFLEATYD